VPRHPGLRLRNELPPRPAALLASPAAAVVVHRCLPCEEVQVRGGVAHRTRIRPADRSRMVRHGRRIAAQLQRAWGPPDEVAGTVAAWNLERIRRELAARPVAVPAPPR
jgi:hypothetical protein